MAAPLRDPSDAVLAEMFGAEDDEDEFDSDEDEDEDLDDEYGAWDASSANTLEAARSFAQAMNLRASPMTAEPAGHWVVSDSSLDLDDARRAAETICSRLKVRWMLLDNLGIVIWVFAPR